MVHDIFQIRKGQSISECFKSLLISITVQPNYLFYRISTKISASKS